MNKKCRGLEMNSIRNNNSMKKNGWRSRKTGNNK